MELLDREKRQLEQLLALQKMETQRCASDGAGGLERAALAERELGLARTALDKVRQECEMLRGKLEDYAVVLAGKRQLETQLRDRDEQCTRLRHSEAERSKLDAQLAAVTSAARQTERALHDADARAADAERKAEAGQQSAWDSAAQAHKEREEELERGQQHLNTIAALREHVSKLGADAERLRGQVESAKAELDIVKRRLADAERRARHGEEGSSKAEAERAEAEGALERALSDRVRIEEQLSLMQRGESLARDAVVEARKDMAVSTKAAEERLQSRDHELKHMKEFVAEMERRVEHAESRAEVSDEARAAAESGRQRCVSDLVSAVEDKTRLSERLRVSGIYDDAGSSHYASVSVPYPSEWTGTVWQGGRSQTRQRAGSYDSSSDYTPDAQHVDVEVHAVHGRTHAIPTMFDCPPGMMPVRMDSMR